MQEFYEGGAMNYQASWIAQAVNGELLGADVTVTGSVESDSRECKAGSLYVARVGETMDGHKFIPVAKAAGAVCTIITDPNVVEPGHSYILVEDATLALGLLAKAHIALLRSQRKLEVIGITGSVGKTTTKDLIHSVLQRFASTVASEKSFNNEVGMPLTALRATLETRFLVLEMGASGPGHLEYLTTLVQPDCVVELAVGKAHLGGFGSVAGLAKAKAELVQGVKPGGVVILNYDDPQVLAMRDLVSDQLLTFSAQGASAADVRATNIELDANSCASFDLVTANETLRVNLGLVGSHQVNNALAAITVALSLGLDSHAVVETVNGLNASSPHRMHVFAANAVTFIDDSYNANPDSMRAGLAVLARMGANAPRRIAVLGEMLELGEASAALHQEVGQYVANSQVDLLITLGDDAKEIAVPLMGKVECHHAPSPAAAITLLKEEIKPGDVVFLKGSNGSGVWRIADAFAAMELNNSAPVETEGSEKC